MELEKRMKRYQQVSDGRLIRRMPVIGRIDGRAFHTFTAGMLRPFDNLFQQWMLRVAEILCSEIQGCKLAYVQSDEISLLLTDYDEFETEAWFDYRTNKMCSIAGGLASAAITMYSGQMQVYDARFFNVPKEDVCNYFVWRQRDATKNSINMYAQSMFAHKDLQNMNGGQLQEKMFAEKQFNWNDAPPINKRGAAVIKRARWEVDYETPEFSKDNFYIEHLLLTNQERDMNVVKCNMGMFGNV